ncbi:unnamed protein product [Miscanthus lutarioriparius]|uniref:Transposase n=1 Tax=Miscanthus lutarioriparius TaxID=422564 RepID=A0A811PDT4_9POAL|nr:unnamed protein product [Miscanthus lutarioriparius]
MPIDLNATPSEEDEDAIHDLNLCATIEDGEGAGIHGEVVQAMQDQIHEVEDREPVVHSSIDLNLHLEALNVSKTKMHKVFKEGLVRRHSSTLKPYLREQNKRERLRFCSTMIDEQTVHTDPKFKDMYNIIHIDE